MRACTLVVAALALTGCGRPLPDAEVVTLYRYAVDGRERVHLATFDTTHGRDFNWLNCTAAAESLNAREDTIVPYWCERGRFQP